MVNILLQENGDALLQETGDYILLDIGVPIFIRSEIYRLGLSHFNKQLVSDDAVIKLRKGGVIKI